MKKLGLVLFFFVLLKFLMASPLHVHIFMNLESEAVEEFGNDLFSQVYDDHKDEIFFEFGFTIETIRDKMMELQKNDKSKATLLIYPKQNTNNDILIKEINKISEYFAIRVFIGKDYKMNENNIKIGEVHYELDDEPRGCESEFTGRTSGSIKIGLGYSFKTDISFKNPLLYDTSKPLGIKGNVPTHYIYIGKNSRKNTYGCKRSYEVNQKNIAKYFRYIETKARYNLVTDNCEKLDLKRPTNIMTSFKSGDKTLYFSMYTKDCAKFNDKLNEAKLLSIDKEITETSYFQNWNVITEHVYEKEDYDLVRTLISINYGYELTKSNSYLSRKQILWKSESEALPTCLTTCHYIQYKYRMWEDAIVDINKKLNILIENFMLTDLLKSSKYKKNENNLNSKHKSEVKDDDGFINRAAIPLPSNRNYKDPISVNIIGNKFCVYIYPGGAIIPIHCDPHDTVETFRDGDRVYVETKRDEERDFKIYGDEPQIAKLTNKLYYLVQDTRYEATVVSVTPKFIYASTFASPVSGLSGAPIYNDENEMVSIYCSTQHLEGVKTYTLSELNDSNDISTKQLTMLRMPNLGSSYNEPEITRIDNTSQVKMTANPPTKPGFYELTENLGSGKSTTYPLKINGHGKNVLLIEPYIGLGNQIAHKFNSYK
jgi:hypothetical protein